MTRIFHISALVWLVATALFLEFGWSPLPGIFLGIGLLLMTTMIKKLPKSIMVCAGAFFLCMLSLSVYQAVVIAPSQQYAGTKPTLCGTVTDVISCPNYASVMIQTPNSLSRGLNNVKIQLVDFNNLDVKIGDVINYQVELENNPDKWKSLYSENIRFSGELLSVEKIAQKDSIAVHLAKYRNTMSHGITRNLTGDEGTILAAMLFGRTAQIPSEIRRDYARSGIAHLLSISGLHLAVFLSILTIILRSFGLSSRTRGIITSFGVVVFMILSGFSYPIIRSGLMMILWVIAQIIGRDADAHNSLGLVVVLILIRNPYAVFSVSLQLSYLATLGIITFTKPMAGWICSHFWKMSLQDLQKHSAWRYNLLTAVSVPFCANLLTLPIVGRTFGYLSFVSPITNLLLSWLIPIALGGGMLSGFMGLIPGCYLIGRFFGFFAGVSVKYINQMAHWWSNLPFAAIPVAQSHLFLWMAVCTIIGVLLWYQRTSPAVKRYAVCLAVVSLLCGTLIHKVIMRNTILFAVDTYGTSLTCVYGKQALIIGAPDSFENVENIRSFLDDSGAQKVALLVAQTHADLLKSTMTQLAVDVPIENVIALDTSYGFSADVFGQVKVSADRDGTNAVELKIGELTIVKEFDQLALPAHILINKHNELVIDPRLKATMDDHHYASSVFAVRLNE